MANPEHITILKKGVEEWNEWRRNNSVLQPDLSNSDHGGANLRGADLTGVYLRDTTFAMQISVMQISGVQISAG